MDMLTNFGVRFRYLMLFLMLLIFLAGFYFINKMPVDVLPELSSPTVTILTDIDQMSPEAVEMQVSLPIETALQGLSNLRRIRSQSGVGLSIITVEFDWQIKEEKARQLVMERLATVSLPEQAEAPLMMPPSSIMGEIIFLGLTPKEGADLTEIRAYIDSFLKPRLLAVNGVAQVTALGAGAKAILIELDENLLIHYQISAKEVLESLEEADGNLTSGYHIQGPQAFLVRTEARSKTISDFQNLALKKDSLRLGDVAKVSYSELRPIGRGSVAKKPAIILAIGRAPNANTLEVSRSVDEALARIQLPVNIEMNLGLFRQERFINAAISSLKQALFEGSILVILVVVICLMSIRASLVCLLALPLSLILALLILDLMGITINTMTLGGLTISIGALVDDAIVFVENTLRNFRHNDNKMAKFDLIALSLKQILKSIFYATIIIVAVFMPLFFLSGIEGRLFMPLSIAYVIALLSSLLVAIFISPALIAIFGLANKHQEGSLAERFLISLYRPILNFTLRRPKLIITFGLALAVFSIFYIASLGTSFLPPFREGALTIEMSSLPGASLDEIDKIGNLAEGFILEIDGVIEVSRRSGRALDDAHAVDEIATEIEVVLDLKRSDREFLIDQIRQKLSLIPGVDFNIGQPISHRIDHILSGARAMLVVAVFGEDLLTIESFAKNLTLKIAEIEGLVDIAMEAQGEQPELRFLAKLNNLANYNLTPQDLALESQLLFDGVHATNVLSGSLKIPVIARYLKGPRQKDDLLDFPIVSDDQVVLLGDLMEVAWHRGPNRIGREDRQRRVLVMANVSGIDPGTGAMRLQKLLDSLSLPKGVYLELRGQFEAREAASKKIFLMSFVSLFVVGFLLYLALDSIVLALLTLFSLPLSLAGGALGIYFSSGIVSIASLIGFLTLFGIAARNGILLLERFRDHYEMGKSIEEAVISGTQERIMPVFMTAISAALGLLPLVLAANQPGNEIQAPMAAVILGGLISSTILSIIVIPALFLSFAKKK